MKTTKLTILKIKKQRTTICRANFRPLQAVCPSCGEMRRMFSATQAAQILDLSERQIFSMVENGKFHIFETSGGHLFICEFSINQAAQD